MMRREQYEETVEDVWAYQPVSPCISRNLVCS